MLPEHMVHDYNPSALSVRRIKGLQDIVSKRKSGYGGRKQINPPPCPGLIHWTQKSTDFIILNHYRNIRFFFFFLNSIGAREITQLKALPALVEDPSSDPSIHFG